MATALMDEENSLAFTKVRFNNLDKMLVNIVFTGVSGEEGELV